MEHSRRIDMGHVSSSTRRRGFALDEIDRSPASSSSRSLVQQLNTRNLVPRVGPGLGSLVNTPEERVKVRGLGRDARDKESPGGEREYIQMLENDSSGSITRKKARSCTNA